MKKIFSLFAAALLIAACTPKEEVGTPFQAGQKVTLAASMGTDDAEQTSGKQRVSGVDNGTQINLTWDEGDQITVKVGDATEVFTLESGAGSASATFTGTMPAAGSTYQVSYPANYDESVLANQTYVANGFSKGLMKMSTKSDGTLDGGFVLSADNALLGLQLTGSDALSKIVLTNPATSKTYTLSCAGVTLSNTETLFYIVVPAGEWPNGFTVLVKDSEGNDITSFAKESAAIFSATEAMVMPVKEVEKPFVPEYVDLGLPSGLKWATCNVGAVTPEEYGDYFAWGEVETKANYTYQNYKWWTNGNYEQITKYCSNHSYGTRDNKKELEASDDAATANWGEGWRIPTSTEFDELIDNCTWTWTTQNSVQGWKVSANGKSIFLPAAGSFSNVLQYAGSNGAYWTCSNNGSTSYYSYALIFTNSVKACDKENFRYVGYSVRPVQGEKIALSLATLTTTVATQITENSALVGGNVTADGNATVTERGVVYSTSSNPTIANNKLASGNGTGSFTCTLTDLQDNTTYYVRAYATNSVGTAYGAQISFKTDKKAFEYVDLGLSVKWATYNIGATTPAEYGDYFAWGEVEPKTEFSWETYKWYNSSLGDVSKYYMEYQYGRPKNSVVLGSADDAATVNWGEDWRMPTRSEIKELTTNCTWTLTSEGGVEGWRVSATNGNSIFLPIGPSSYWSSSLSETANTSSKYSDCLNVSSSSYSLSTSYRYSGKVVRPVRP